MLEKKKLIFLFNMYENILLSNKDKEYIIYGSDNCKKYSYTDLKILVVTIPSVQIKILIIILLFILGILGKKMAIVCIIHIMTNNNQKINHVAIEKVLDLELFYLIGLYFYAYDLLLDDK